MRILLDTHVWIWTQETPEQLGPRTCTAISDEDNGLFVSPISSLEISRLATAGRLTLAGRVQTWVSESLNALLADTVPLTHEIAITAYELPGEFHHDPADRMLVATARLHDLTLMTADERILNYPNLMSMDARA